MGRGGVEGLVFVFVFVSLYLCLVSEEYSGLDGLCREMLLKKRKGEGRCLLVGC